MSHEHHHHEHHKVRILINGKPFEVHHGKHSVEQLKHLADIPKEDILCVLEGGQLRPLKDHEEIHVKEGESFVSQVPSCKSS